MVTALTGTSRALVGLFSTFLTVRFGAALEARSGWAFNDTVRTNVVTTGDFTENGVLAVQMRRPGI